MADSIPTSLPSQFVDDAKKGRQDSWLRTIGGGIDTTLASAQAKLDEVQTGVAETIAQSPFATAFKAGNDWTRELPSLDDLTPDWVREGLAREQAAKRPPRTAPGLTSGDVTIEDGRSVPPYGTSRDTGGTSTGRYGTLPGPASSTEPLEMVGTGDVAEPERFFGASRPLAETVEREFGIPAAFTQAVAANETGYGQQRYQAGKFNYHGIQDTTGTGTPYRDWRPGPNGERIYYEARQAGYASPLEGFRAFGRFLHENPRYRPALERYRQTQDAEQFARDVHAAGYAEDPAWSDKVTSIMRGIPVSTGVGSVTAQPGVAPRGGAAAARPAAMPQASAAPDGIADRYDVAFGFNQPYDNPFNPSIPNHRGVDLVIRGAKNGGKGEPVPAFQGGTVFAVTSDPNGGNGVIVLRDDGRYDYYGHFEALENLKPGQRIERGTKLGTLGESGTEGFPHVHYEVRAAPNGDPMDRLIDPTPSMRGENLMQRTGAADVPAGASAGAQKRDRLAAAAAGHSADDGHDHASEDMQRAPLDPNAEAEADEIMRPAIDGAGVSRRFDPSPIVQEEPAPAAAPAWADETAGGLWGRSAQAREPFGLAELEAPAPVAARQQPENDPFDVPAVQPFDPYGEGEQAATPWATPGADESGRYETGPDARGRGRVRADEDDEPDDEDEAARSTPGRIWDIWREWLGGNGERSEAADRLISGAASGRNLPRPMRQWFDDDAELDAEDAAARPPRRTIRDERGELESVIDPSMGLGEAASNAFRRGVVNTRAGMVGALAQAARDAGADDWADRWEAEADGIQAELYDNPRLMRRRSKDVFDDPLSGIVEGVAESATSLVPTIVGTVLAVGGATVKQPGLMRLGTGLARLGLAAGATSAYGSKSLDLRDEVASGQITRDQQRAAAVLAGATEVVTERIFGGGIDGAVRKGLAARAGAEYAQELARRGLLAGAGRKVGGEMAQEATEEALAEAADIALDHAFSSEKPGLVEALRKVANAGVIGGVSGGLLAGPVAAGEALAERGSRQAASAQPSMLDDDEDEGGTGREYSSTQLDLPAPVANQVKAMAARVRDADLAENGREDRPHVTVKYGLETADVEDVRAIVEAHGPITVTLGKTSIFPANKQDGGKPGAFDVVKIDVDSKELRALNAELAKLPNGDTHPTYRPHVTLAYVKAGKGAKYAGSGRLAGQKVTIDKLTFSSKSGEEVVIPLAGRKQAGNDEQRLTSEFGPRLERAPRETRGDDAAAPSFAARDVEGDFSPRSDDLQAEPEEDFDPLTTPETWRPSSAPAAGTSHRVYVPSSVPQEMADAVASRGYVSQTAKLADRLHRALSSSPVVRAARRPGSQFVGLQFTRSPRRVAVNFFAGRAGGPNSIYLDPWKSYRTVRERAAGRGVTENSPEFARMLADDIVESVAHEYAHNLAKGHHLGHKALTQIAKIIVRGHRSTAREMVETLRRDGQLAMLAEDAQRLIHVAPLREAIGGAERTATEPGRARERRAPDREGPGEQQPGDGEGLPGDVRRGRGGSGSGVSGGPDRGAERADVRGADGDPADRGRPGNGGNRELTPGLLQAFADWGAGRAYIDGRGNYHVKPEGKSSGPIAPWNREAKAAFPDVSAFHTAASAHKVTAASPASLPDPAAVADELGEIEQDKRGRSLHAKTAGKARRKLDELEQGGIDVAEARDALQEYEDVNREDYEAGPDGAEEYHAAKEDAYEQFLQALQAAEPAPAAAPGSAPAATNEATKEEPPPAAPAQAPEPEEDASLPPEPVAVEDEAERLRVEVERLRAENARLRAERENPAAPQTEPADSTDTAGPETGPAGAPPADVPPDAPDTPDDGDGDEPGRIRGFGYHADEDGAGMLLRPLRAAYERDELERVPMAETAARAEEILGLEPGTIARWQQEQLDEGTEGRAVRSEALRMAAYADEQAAIRAAERLAEAQERLKSITDAGGLDAQAQLDVADALLEAAETMNRLRMSGRASTAEGTATARALAQRRGIIVGRQAWEAAERGRALAKEAEAVAEIAGQAAGDGGALDEDKQRRLQRLRDRLAGPDGERLADGDGADGRLGEMERRADEAKRKRARKKGQADDAEPRGPKAPRTETFAERLGKLKRLRGIAEDAGNDARVAELDEEVDALLAEVRIEAAARAQQIVNQTKEPLTAEEAERAVNEAIGRKAVSRIRKEALDRAKGHAQGRFVSQFDQALGKKIDAALKKQAAEQESLMKALDAQVQRKIEQAFAAERRAEVRDQVRRMAEQARLWMARAREMPNQPALREELDYTLRVMAEHSNLGEVTAGALRDQYAAQVDEDAFRFRADLERRLAEAERGRQAEGTRAELKALHDEARTWLSRASKEPDSPALEEAFQAAAERLAAHSAKGGELALDLLGRLEDARAEAAFTFTADVEKRLADAARSEAARLQKEAEQARIGGVVAQIDALLENPRAPGAAERWAELQADLAEISTAGFERASDIKKRLFRTNLIKAGLASKTEDVESLVRALARVDPNDRRMLRDTLNIISTPRLWDILQELQYINLLSSPITNLVNASSNTMNVAGRVLLAAPLEAFYLAARERDMNALGEVAAALAGARQGAREGSREAKEIMRTGVSADEMQRAIEMGDASPIARELLAEKLGKAGELAHMAVTRPMEAADELLGTAAWWSGFRQHAFRKARRLARSAGPWKGDVRGAFEDILANPWDHEDIIREARKIKEHAILRTGPESGAEAIIDRIASLRNPYALARERARILRGLGNKGASDEPVFADYLTAALANTVIPFWRTPVVFFKQGVDKVAAPITAPVGAVRKAAKGELTPDEEARYVHRVGIAIGALALAAALAAADNLTGDGPDDDDDRKVWEQTHRRNAFRIPGTEAWISWEGTPLAIPFSVVANAKEGFEGAQKAADKKGARLTETERLLAVGKGSGKGLVSGFLSQSFVRNIQDAYNAVSGEGGAESFASSVATRPIPLSSFWRFVARVGDDFERDMKAAADPETGLTVVPRIMNQLPGLRGMLPERLDIYGEPVRNEQRAPMGLLPYYRGPAPREGDAITERLQSASVGMPGAPDELSFRGMKIPLTPMEKRAFEEAWGKAFRRELEGIQRAGRDYPDEAYQKARDEGRKEAEGRLLDRLGAEEIRRRVERQRPAKAS